MADHTYKITWTDSNKEPEEVKADWYKDVDKTWIDFEEGLVVDGIPDTKRIVRVRSADVARIDTL